MLFVALLLAAALAQQPVPKPFPGAATPARPAPPPQEPGRPAPQASPVERPRADAAPSEADLGVNLYPGARFLASYEAGRGQRFHLFGTTASFVAIVAYYREILKQRGDLVFDVPATHMFEIGRFRDETMAFPPSVTIKDFQSELSQGFPNPTPGAEPARYPTIIQIVPVPAAER